MMWMRLPFCVLIAVIIFAAVANMRIEGAGGFFRLIASKPKWRPVAFGLLCVIAGWILAGRALLAMPFAMVGVLAPGIVTEILEKRRLRQVEAQLAGWLELVASGLKAGIGLELSVQQACGRMGPPAAASLSAAIDRTRMGQPIMDALFQACDELKSDLWRDAIAGISVARESGAGLSEIMAGLAENVRQQHGLQDKVDTLTAQSRASAWVIAIMPAALLAMLHVMEPSMVRPLFGTVPGNLMLLCAATCVVSGGFILNRLCSLEG